MNKELTFEEKMEKLKDISTRLENNNTLSLEVVMSLYEEGKTLAKELQDELDSAIKKFENVETSEIINKK